MGRVGGRRLTSFALFAAALAAALAAWLLAGRAEESNDADAAGRAAAGVGEEAPVLTAAVAAAARAPEAGAAPDSEPALAGVALEAPREERIGLRLVDRHGRPLSFARVTLRVEVKDARGTRTAGVTAEADAEGRAAFDVPSRRVLSVEVAMGGGGTLRTLASFDGGADAAELERADLVAEGLEVLRVRTVDGKGNWIRDRRVLYRSRVEGVEPTGWWGDRSDMQALLVLGPFPSGSEVEIAPGPRSTGDTQREPGPWQRVRVDGTEASVNVGDAPRLRLRIPGVAPSAEVPINGQPYRLENGIWLGPEIDLRFGMDVMVGPLPDGRFAWLRSLYATEQPHDIELEPGMSVSGRVTGLASTTGGTVTAHGDRFALTVPMDRGGAFHFPGLPTLRDPVALQAESDDDLPYVAQATWSGEARVEMEAVRAVAVRGRVTVEGDPDVGRRLEVWASVAGFRQAWRAQIERDGAFRVRVPRGHCTLEAAIDLTGGGGAWAERDLGVLEQPIEDLVIPMDGAR